MRIEEREGPRPFTKVGLVVHNLSLASKGAALRFSNSTSISIESPSLQGNGMLLRYLPSATSISSPSPSTSIDSTIVPVLSTTHTTRRPFRPFTASETGPSLQCLNPRHRLIPILVVGNYRKGKENKRRKKKKKKKKKKEKEKEKKSQCPAAERSYLTYISVLPQFQCALHQIFTGRTFYVPIVSQVFIPYFIITGRCYKALRCYPINQWDHAAIVIYID